MTPIDDTQRLEYIMAMLDLIVPAGEKAGANLSRHDIDRVMGIWPSPEACIAAMVPQTGQGTK